MTVLELKDVDFGYDEGHIVLHDINLTISEPGLYCIIGPNGVGKSTMAKCVSKIVNPLNGEVLINGKNISHMTHKEVSQVVGYVPAFSQDVFSMSVVDTIMVGRHNHRKWGSREKDLEMVYKAMRIMRITDLADKKYNSLSSGQHQKVSIARGLVQETEVLILDEPTANLDVKFQVYVMELPLRADATGEVLEQFKTFNENLAKVAEHAGATLIPLFDGPITAETAERYYIDGRLHPNRLGMDVITEAAKKTILEHTAWKTEPTHTVAFDLDGVEIDYGTAERLVVSGRPFTGKLKPVEAKTPFSVEITMDGRDITADVYKDGNIKIDAVTGDVVIRAATNL